MLQRLQRWRTPAWAAMRAETFRFLLRSEKALLRFATCARRRRTRRTRRRRLPLLRRAAAEGAQGSPGLAAALRLLRATRALCLRPACRRRLLPPQRRRPRRRICPAQAPCQPPQQHLQSLSRFGAPTPLSPTPRLWRRRACDWTRCHRQRLWTVRGAWRMLRTSLPRLTSGPSYAAGFHRRRRLQQRSTSPRRQAASDSWRRPRPRRESGRARGALRPRLELCSRPPQESKCRLRERRWPPKGEGRCRLSAGPEAQPTRSASGLTRHRAREQERQLVSPFDRHTVKKHAPVPAAGGAMNVTRSGRAALRGARRARAGGVRGRSTLIACPLIIPLMYMTH